jgi:hypothetical protein
MRPLDNEIAAYDRMLGTLMSKYHGRWVVFHGGTFVGAFADFASAADKAVERFGRGPYLIRRVGVPRSFANPSRMAHGNAHRS